MPDTFTAEWYDTAMTEPDAPAMLPLEESPWLEMYEALAAMIKPHEAVVDLGCGTGRFIELLRRNGHSAKHTGIDWSEAALEEAFIYYGGNVLDRALSFRREDLREWEPDPDRASNTVYVCSEVLEHLDDDLGLVARIPRSHRFLFSVPNFDSEAHVRVFATFGEVWERYSDLLAIHSNLMVGDFHVVRSVRR